MKLFDALKLDEVYDVFNSGFEHLGENSPLPDLKHCFITTGNVVQIFDMRKITVSENEMGLAIDSTKEKENKIASVAIHFDENQHPEFVQFITGRYSFNQMAAIEKLNAYFTTTSYIPETPSDLLMVHTGLGVEDICEICDVFKIKNVQDPILSKIVETANRGYKSDYIINKLNDEQKARN